MTSVPNRPNLLLATDLSGRCDRAQARAEQLVSAWQTDLHIVHAVEPSKTLHAANLTSNLPSWRRPEDRQTAVLRRLRNDLDADTLAATVHVVEGKPAQVVLDIAQRENVGLVITGLARDEPLARIQRGSTVDELLSKLTTPLLSVRGRVRGPYQHVVIATDFSPESLPALEAAVRWFGDGRLTLFHAFDSPQGNLASNVDMSKTRGAAAMSDCNRFLVESTLPPEAMQSLSRVIEAGSPEVLLPDYVRHEGVDLVVLGSHGRTGLLKALLGSTAETLLHRLDCDTMVVRSR
jgi:nucleotide-binding universal stress UspA family protein